MDKFPQPDFKKIERAKQRLRNVWAYRRVDHIPVFIRISGRSGHTRREIIEDSEIQFQVNKNNLERSLRTLPDDYIPYARVWLGYMTIATMFGLPVHWSEDPEQSPGVAHPLIKEDIQDVYGISKPRTLSAGLMPDNLRLQRMFAERFPRWVHLTGFDLGGPLNNSKDLIESNLLYISMVEQPEALHYLLDILTDLQIECYQAAIEASGGLDRMTCIDMAQIWMPEGHKGFLSDDVSAMISPYLFEIFSKPYNNRIFTHWSGGLLHNCGPNPAAEFYLEHSPPINGINCSYRYSRDDFPKLRKAFAGKGVVQVMFDNEETAEEMLEGFHYMIDTLAPEVIGMPMPIVNDSWKDAEITDFYNEMRVISTEYAANMQWRESPG